MSVVCLVRPLLSPADFNGYPLNLLILASALRERGHRVEICDYDFLKEIDPTWIAPGFAQRAAADILSRSPDFVGITAMCSNYVLALDVAKQLRDYATDVHITLGGPHVSLCAPQTIARHPYIDTTVIGEGEVTYPELIHCVASGGDLGTVSGIAFRVDGHVMLTPRRPLLSSLDQSPRPAYDLIDVRAYTRASNGGYLELYAGSGCPFECTFCSTSIVWERKYRTMPAERVVDEMEILAKEHGAAAFNLVHDNLTTDKKFIAKISALIRERGLSVRWGFSSRVDTIDLETMQIAAAAGCDYVFFGIESGSERTQRTMRKRLKLHKIYERTEECIENGIAPTTSFILGFPDEDIEDVAKTIRLAFTCRVMGARRSFINLLSAYTGTPVMEAGFEGLTFDRESANSTMVSFLEEHHYEQIKADPFIFANYYSLDYKESPFNAKEFLNLVDFFTIGLFRYPHIISFLINDRGVDPIEFFRRVESRVEVLSVEQRNRLDFDLLDTDIDWFVGSAEMDVAHSMLLFDRAIWLARTSQPAGVLFTGPLRLDSGRNLRRIAPEPTDRYYLLVQRGDVVHASELTSEVSALYELRGLLAVKRYRTSAQETTR